MISRYAALSLALCFIAAGTHAQTAPQQLPGITRADLLRNDLSVSGREVIQVRVDIPPGVVAPNHRHPGEEIAYVLTGTLEYRLDDGAPVTVRAGEALFIPAGTAHSATNSGRDTASELATYVVEKDKPLITLVK